MGVCYWAEVNGEVERDNQGDGKAVARAAPKLTKLADKLGVPVLESFISVSDYQEFLEEAGVDDVVQEASATETWHSAADGLKAVQAMLGYLHEHPDYLNRGPDVLADLGQSKRS